jgi:flagellar biosynthesis protein FlhB
MCRSTGDQTLKKAEKARTEGTVQRSRDQRFVLVLVVVLVLG